MKGKIGIALLALVALVAAGTVALVRTQEAKPSVTAIFADASPLVKGNLVKTDGVTVGEISSIELNGGRAVVRMDLDKSVLPLHDDASVQVRAVSLLGERYIELHPGSAARPAMSLPATIPEDRASRSTGLDDVLNMLNDPTSTALAALVTTLGEGTSGQGRNIDAALKALAPAMTDTSQLGKVLSEQNQVLDSLVDNVTPVAEAVAGSHGKQLDDLVGSADRSLHAVSAQSGQLDTALQELPGTLQKARQTLAEVAGVSDRTASTLSDVRPLTDNLPAVTNELSAFADSAKPALASLPPVLDRAQKLLDQAAPLVRDLRPGASALNSVSSSGDHLVADLAPRLTVVLDFMKNWALSTNGRDGLGNYFRGVVADTPRDLLQAPGLSLGQGQQPPANPQPAVPQGASPAPAAPAPGPATSSPAPASPNVNNGSATGLNQTQEQSLLRQLLGGQ